MLNSSLDEVYNLGNGKILPIETFASAATSITTVAPPQTEKEINLEADDRYMITSMFVAFLSY